MIVNAIVWLCCILIGWGLAYYFRRRSSKIQYDPSEIKLSEYDKKFFRIIERRWPGVIVGHEPDYYGDCGNPYYPAYYVPDDKDCEFLNWCNRFWMKAYHLIGVMLPDIMSHTVESTNQFYNYNVERETERRERSAE